MANNIQLGGVSRGSGITYSVKNLDPVIRALNDIGDEFRSSPNPEIRATGIYLRRMANSEMRKAAKAIANEVLIPQIHRAARSSPHPDFARAMANTARAKSDRYVTVAVGAVNPALSGFKRGVGAKKAKGTYGGGRDRASNNYRTTLAWGSEFGPYPGAEINHYGKPRNEAGYYVLPAVANSLPKARDRWISAIRDILRRYA